MWLCASLPVCVGVCVCTWHCGWTGQAPSFADAKPTRLNAPHFNEPTPAQRDDGEVEGVSYELGAWLTFVCQQNCVKFNSNNNSNGNDNSSKSYNNQRRSSRTFYHDVLALTSVSSTCHIVTLRPGRIVAAATAPITVVVLLAVAVAAAKHVFHAVR